MAEIAIPIIALGSLFIASNNEKNPSPEGFQNERKSKRHTPQTIMGGGDKRPITNSLNTNEEFVNPSEGNNKYYKRGGLNEIKKVTQEPMSTSFNSLTGKTMDVSEFRHNNMQPFFGSKVKGKYGDENHESILDSFNGAGSQQIEKQERAPLFKPTSDSAHIFGAPNMNDFYASRINESLKKSNTKPWEEERVAPGLNKGFTTGGGDGFNSGMQARDMWAPKDVDELRVKTNPKQSFNLVGLEGPAISKVTELGSLGKVEKHAPDTFFVNNKERWFTTVGGEKAPAGRGNYRESHNVGQSVDYTGIMGSGNGPGSGTALYAPQNFEDAKKQQLAAKAFLGGHASNKNAGEYENFASGSYNILNNNRSTDDEPEKVGFFGGTIGSVISPFLDIMKPSRKQNLLKNVRESGNVNGAKKAPYLEKQDGAAPKTLREINGQKVHLNVQSQQDGAYHVTEHQKVFNQRETTNVGNYGNVGGGVTGLAPSSTEATVNQRDNPYKEHTTYNRFEHGSQDQFNNSVNVKIQKFDADRNNNRMFVSTNAPTKTIGPEQMSQTTKYPQIGGVGQSQRMDGDLLQAFKDNPYTHSLSSAP